MEADIEIQIERDRQQVLKLEMPDRETRVTVRFDRIRGSSSLRLLRGRQPVAMLTRLMSDSGTTVSGYTFRVGSGPAVTEHGLDRKTGEFLKTVLMDHRRTLENRQRTETSWESGLNADPSELVDDRNNSGDEDVRSILRSRARELTRDRYNYTEGEPAPDDSS